MNNTQASNLEAEIISAIKSVPAKVGHSKGNGMWTAEIKRSLIELGKSHGYLSCASGFSVEDVCDREWLYDLVWYKNLDGRQLHLKEIGLVLESEWSINREEIRHDFEKLLVAKSPVKVIVFQDHQGNLGDLMQFLETGIRTFQAQPANERYILAGWDNGKDINNWAEDAKDAWHFKMITA